MAATAHQCAMLQFAAGFPLGARALTIKIVEPFDLRAELEKLNQEAREYLKQAQGQVIEMHSSAQSQQPALPDSGTRTLLQGENKV